METILNNLIKAEFYINCKVHTKLTWVSRIYLFGSVEPPNVFIRERSNIASKLDQFHVHKGDWFVNASIIVEA